MATQALAPRDNTAVQRADNEHGRLRAQLETRAEDFKMALPAHITPEKFQRTVLTAAQSNPDILKADRASLITAAMKAAQDGLLPDGREAALVTFNTRKQINGSWQTVVLAQYMPMVFGLRKKILQSGEISSIETNVVYRAEVEAGAFIFEAGTEAMLRHRPMLELDEEQTADDQIVAAYSVAVMKDGAKSFEVMRRSEINKVRQASQTGALGKTTRDGKKIDPKGPWVDWFGEMARKTVMRRHSKTLPMNSDLIDVEAVDEALLARSATAVLAAVEPDAPRPITRGDAAQVEHDLETGEITEADARALDRESFAAMEGRDAPNDGTLADDNPAAAEGPADEQRGGDVHPGTDIADELIDRYARARLAGDVVMAENDFTAHGEAMLDEDRTRVDEARAAANTRLGR